jgi:hypothetical protein
MKTTPITGGSSMADIKTLVEEAKRLFGLSAPFDHQQREFDAALDALAEAHLAEVARLTRERDELNDARNAAIERCNFMHGATREAQEFAAQAQEEARRLTRENEGLAKDAARYRWLRECDWFTSSLCVLYSPKEVFARGGALGADCPSRGRLDASIDAALAGASGAQEGERT